MTPEGKRNAKLFCLFSMKTACTRNLNRVTVAGYIVLNAKGMNMIALHLEILLVLRNLFKYNRKWQLWRNNAKRIHHALKAFWSNKCKRLCTVCISHCQKEPREAAYMISMVMCKTDHIDWITAPAFFSHCDLCSLSTVNH